MKFINRIFAIIFASLVAFSCANTELDLQDNPNAITPENASLNDVYNAVQLGFAGVYASAEFNPGAVARMYHTTAFSYEAATTSQTYNGLWFNAYASLFPDVNTLIQLAEGGDTQFDIHAGTAKIMKAYTLMVLVDLFGDVPNEEALQGTDIISPGNDGDGGSKVYGEAVALLDEAITQLTGTTAGAPAYDNFYGGDPARWITFANTLKLRAALNTGDVSAINSLTDIIDDNSKDFQRNFGTNRNNPNSRSRMYNNHYEQGDGDYLSNYYMWLLADEKGSIDPRTRYYFYRKVDDALNQDPTTYSCHFSALPDKTAAGANLAHWDAVDPNFPYCALDNGFSGRDHLNGEGIPPDGPIRTSYGLYPGGGSFDDDTFTDTRQAGTTGGLGGGIMPIMLASFVDFMKAEGVLRLGASGDARALLEAGIQKSLDKVEGFEGLVAATMSSTVVLRDGSTGTIKELFGMDAASKQAYIDDVLALYDAETTDAGRLAVVTKEFYIAAWGNGLEAYNMYRRTGYPSNMQPPMEPVAGNFPRSMFYPTNHSERNSNVDQKADLRTDVFWSTGAALSGNP